MRSTLEILGGNSSAQAPSRPLRRCPGCGGGCAGDCWRRRGQAEVLFLSRSHTGHKGLGWNGWHSANALASRGVTARSLQISQEEIATAVAEIRPRVVVPMAFWVPIETIDKLSRQFPETVFVVKNHSGPQFLAQERTGWSSIFAIADLAARRSNVKLAAIKPEFVAAARALGIDAVELPNVYSPAELVSTKPTRLPGFHVGLFGAYRPLKNAVGMTLAVALAASRSRGKKFTLHVNGTRSEMGAANDAAIIKEFCQRAGIDFVHHGWLDHEPFKQLAGSMHVCLAASFSETYNYVAADCITAGAPVVGSDAIYWLPPAWRVNPDSTEEIASALLASSTWNIDTGLNALRRDNASALTRLINSLRALDPHSQAN